MARRTGEEAARRREAVRDRVKFLLEYRWAGNQRQMARDMGVSQGLISKIVNGVQGAGKRFLATLARQPGVNADWLLRGEGQPLSLPPKGTLPVALGVLPGPPQEHFHLFTGQRHPVAEALDRATRYWLELQAAAPLVRDTALRLMTGDLLLMESDPAWTSRLDLVEGRLCGVRLEGGLPEPAYPLGKLYRGPLGFVLDTLDRVHRLIEGASPQVLPPPPTTPATPEMPGAETRDSDRPRKRRTIRPLHREEAKAKLRQLHADERRRQDELAGQQQAADEPAERGDDTFTLQDVVGVCVYLARPSPGLVREERAER